MYLVSALAFGSSESPSIVAGPFPSLDMANEKATYLALHCPMKFYETAFLYVHAATEAPTSSHVYVHSLKRAFDKARNGSK